MNQTAVKEGKLTDRLKGLFALPSFRLSIYDLSGVGFLALMALVWTFVSLSTRPFPNGQAYALILKAYTPEGVQSGLELLISAWFSVLPVTDFFYYLFHQLHLFVALLGVWACARFMFGAQKALLVACLSAFIPLVSVLGLGSLSAVLILAAGWTWLGFGMVLAVSNRLICGLSLIFFASYYASIANHGLVFILPGYILWLTVGRLVFSKPWQILLAIPTVAALGWLGARIFVSTPAIDLAIPLQSGQFPGSLALVATGFLLLCLGALLLGLRFKLRQERWFANDVTYRVYAVGLLWVSGMAALFSWVMPHDWYQLIWTNVQPVEALTILALLPLPLLMLFLATNAETLSNQGSPFLRGTGALGGFALSVLATSYFSPKQEVAFLEPKTVQQLTHALSIEHQALPFDILVTNQAIALGLLRDGSLNHKFVDQNSLAQISAIGQSLEEETDVVGLCLGSRLNCPDLTATVDKRLVVKTIDLQGAFDQAGQPVQAIVVRAELPSRGLPTLRLNTDALPAPQTLPPGLVLSPSS